MSGQTQTQINELKTQLKNEKKDIKNKKKINKELLRIEKENIKNDLRIEKENEKELLKIEKENIKNDLRIEKENEKELLKIEKENIKNDLRIEKENIKNDLRIEKENIKNDLRIEKENEKKNKYIFKEFSKKKEALAYQEKITTSCKVFGMDANSINGCKKFIVSNDFTILQNISEGCNSFYENIEKEQELAFGLDLDIKNLDVKTSVEDLKVYIMKIFNIIIVFYKKEFGVCLTSANFLTTKSPYCCKKKKHSFHIKVVGYKFPCPYAVKFYFNKMNLNEKEHGVDNSIYRTGLIRTTFSTKKGQNRPLLPFQIEEGNIYIENDIVENSLEYFKESLWCNVKGYKSLNCNEYIDILEEKEIEKNKTILQEQLMIDEYTPDSVIIGDMYDIEALANIINIIDFERFENENEWKKLMWILKNQEFDCFSLFDKVSSLSKKYEGTDITKKLWDNSEKGKYNYSVGTLKFWAKEDNKDTCNIEDVVDVYRTTIDIIEKFDVKEIKKIILSCCIGKEDEKDLIVSNKNIVILKVLKYLNRFFIKIKNLGGKVLFVEQLGMATIMRDKKNLLDFLEDGGLNFSYRLETEQGMKTVEYPKEKGDIKNSCRLWLTSPLKASCQSITFYPDETKVFKNTYNLFKGLHITHEHANNTDLDSDINPLKNHILYIWCKGNKIVFEYTIKLLAFYLQNKHIKSGVALVISGDKGTGKSCIIEKFLEIFGDYGKIINKLESILGNFNSILKDVLMVYVNEATFTGNKEETNKLRNLITSPEVYVNEKYMPQYTMKNYTNFIIDGNSESLVSNHGQERRYLILETDNKWRGVDTVDKKKYFDPIVNVSPLAFAKWLFSIDISDFNIRAIPETDNVLKARINSFEGCEEFFYNLIDENVHKGFETKTTMQDLYFDYTEYSKGKYTFTQNKFSRELTRLMAIKTKSRTLLNGERHWVVIFDSVTNCKVYFENIFGKISWSQNEDIKVENDECLFD
jgi:hypothetical protein